MLQDRKRDCADAIVGLDCPVCAGSLRVDNEYPFTSVRDPFDHGPELHRWPDPVVNRVSDPVHTADRLEYRRLLIDSLLENEADAPIFHVGYRLKA